MAKVYHSEIFGLREAKYDWLNKHNFINVKWNKLKPRSEFYLFTPQDDNIQKNYNSYLKLSELFPINSVGLVTARDSLTIAWTENDIWNRVQNFIRLEPELARQTYRLGKDVRDWKVINAQNDLKGSNLSKEKITSILYRPFDKRYTYYTGKSRGFIGQPCVAVMSQMLKDNLALCVGRQFGVIGSENYDIVFLSENIVDFNLYRRGGELVFPLYLYLKTDKKDLFSEFELSEKKPNIKTEIFQQLKTIFKKEVTPEEIFYYIYAVLFSNAYRTKYAEFLKIDFPRIPFTKDYKLFIKFCKLGKELTDLHLLKSKELDKTISKFPVSGNNKVEKLNYVVEKVWINKEQYFSGVNEVV